MGQRPPQRCSSQLGATALKRSERRRGTERDVVAGGRFWEGKKMGKNMVFVEQIRNHDLEMEVFMENSSINEGFKRKMILKWSIDSTWFGVNVYPV
jgi:hypothetical protein